MLTIFRRHLASCGHSSRTYKRCSCPIHVHGSLAGEKIRKSLDLTSWEAAQKLVREWEVAGKILGTSFAPITPDEATAKLLSDLRARHISEATLCKYQTLINQLLRFSQDKGIAYVHKFTIEDLREFRASWKDNSISAYKKLERLKAMFKFFHQSKWIQDNPALYLKQSIVEQVPTLPFTAEEMQRILDACDKVPIKNSFGFDNRARIKALVLLLRYSGLRITDAVCIQAENIQDGRVFLHTQKTGVPVFLPLPPFVLDALEKVRNGNRYFWTGTSKLESAGKNWQRAFRRLFKYAQVENAHIHRFRDSFAVDLLQKGIPIEMVSKLLGHTSIRITERSYAPWVRTRQEQLENAIKQLWTN